MAIKKKTIAKKTATKKPIAKKIKAYDKGIKVKIKLLNPDKIQIPTRGTVGSAAYDLQANIESELTLIPHTQAKLATGIALEIPQGYHGEVVLRSGVSASGLVLSNAPGIIDSDYRGEIFLSLSNTGRSILKIAPYDRIAQIIFKKNEEVNFQVCDELSETARGEKGFGSTGV
jgi:dUTP pyrophosphatase